jgi:hypothetical protein
MILISKYLRVKLGIPKLIMGAFGPYSYEPVKELAKRSHAYGFVYKTIVLILIKGSILWNKIKELP